MTAAPPSFSSTPPPPSGSGSGSGSAPVPPLWAPYVGVPRKAAVGRFFTKYATFTGRASRSEFWWMILFLNIISRLFYYVQKAIDPSQGGNTGSLILAIVELLFYATILVPSVSLLVRRLHDSNHSSHNLWWMLVPPVALVLFLVFTIQKSNPVGSRFDRPPPR